jgi:hypothetical protein
MVEALTTRICNSFWSKPPFYVEERMRSSPRDLQAQSFSGKGALMP